MRIRAFFVILFVSIAAFQGMPDAFGGPAVIGYYPSWVADELPPREVRFDVFSNVVYAFAWPREDASIETYSSRIYTDLVDEAHRAGSTVTIAFGGGGQAEEFPVVTADPDLRARFIENIIEFCNTNGFDGADFDWEFPTNTTERDNYAALIRELRIATNKFDRPQPFLISMAISAASWTSLANDFADLSDTVDWFMVMAYDYSGPWTSQAGHNAPLYAHTELGYTLSVSKSMDYLLSKRGFPEDKLILGIPFYGRMFDASRLYGPSTGGDALQYTAVKGLIEREEWHVMWDDISKAPYMVNDDSTQVIVYDDPESVAIKCRYARDKGLAGVGVWALGYDASGGEQPLVDAIGSVYGDVFVESDYQTPVPSAAVLSSSYPNPFNAVTTIDVRLDKDSTVALKIYNLTGSEVATLVSGKLQAGLHTFSWDAGGCPSGVYLCRLAAGNSVVSQKMTLLK